MVRAPLFGPLSPTERPGEYHVLLDGARSSFVIAVADHADLDPTPLSWTWSANLNHPALSR